MFPKVPQSSLGILGGYFYMDVDKNWEVVSNIFYFHLYLGKIPILTSILFKWVETTN